MQLQANNKEAAGGSDMFFGRLCCLAMMWCFAVIHQASACSGLFRKCCARVTIRGISAFQFHFCINMPVACCPGLTLAASIYLSKVAEEIMSTEKTWLWYSGSAREAPVMQWTSAGQLACAK